jgi:hypothetical protein
MSTRPIIDAGPGLNFLSVNKERLLIAVLGPLSAPETVRDEVLRKSRQDDRFRAAAMVWRKLAGTQHLPDRAAMRDTYRRLRELDDGLPPIENTNLLSGALWS